MIVLLYGHLGKRFGRRHEYDVRNPAEAVRALSATLDGFRAYLIEHSRPGYRVLVGKEPRTLETIAHPADEAIKIVPVTAGAGRGIGSIILGVALMAVAPYLGGASSFAMAWEVGGGALAGYLATNIGISLVLSGVSQMLAPTPKTAGTPDRPENKPSVAFDGPVNTAAQGNPVPVCYGRLIVGSQVISAGLVAEEYAA
jgi:predicted phage tail protein